MKLSARTVAIILVVAIVGAIGAFKIGKRIVKAYNDFDAAQIKDRGDAPDLQSPVWYNSKPVSLASLRGQVVILDFWRFQCPECLHSMPYLEQVYNRYEGQGLRVLSVHTPETFAEQDLSNVVSFINDNQIKYPVVIDADNALKRQYLVPATPTFILIDKQGRIRYRHIGEGRYEEIEKAINFLLKE
jgi:thiol-disulfide isomerase/thioredoxin